MTTTIEDIYNIEYFLSGFPVQWFNTNGKLLSSIFYKSFLYTEKGSIDFDYELGSYNYFTLNYLDVVNKVQQIIDENGGYLDDKFRNTILLTVKGTVTAFYDDSFTSTKTINNILSSMTDAKLKIIIRT
jgi:hypothetical protein